MNEKIAIGLLGIIFAMSGAAIAADKAEVQSDAKATTGTKGTDIKGSVKNAASEIKETVSDSIITTKIKAEYAKDKTVSAMNIKVDTDQKGIVTLSGNAKTKVEADKAESIAKATQGVTSVKNDIKVGATDTVTKSGGSTAPAKSDTGK